MNITTYDSKAFHRLAGLADADERRRSAAPDALLKLGAVLAAYGYADDVALALLHRHFSLDAGSCLREIVGPRSTITKSVTVDDLGKGDVPHLFAAETDAWMPLEYARVPEDHLVRVQRVVARLREDAAFHADFRIALSDVGLLGVIGITVLHGREDLVGPFEALLETTDRGGRISTLTPVATSDLNRLTNLYETVWLSDGKTCRMACTCQNYDGQHSHFETN